MQNERYMIAYLSVSGIGFDSSLPYVSDLLGSKIEEVFEEKRVMEKLGFKRVTVFQCPKELPDEIGWDFVEAHCVAEHSHKFRV